MISEVIKSEKRRNLRPSMISPVTLQNVMPSARTQHNDVLKWA